MPNITTNHAITYTYSQLACTFHASFLQVPMNSLYKAFYDVGITEILLFLITFLVI